MKTVIKIIVNNLITVIISITYCPPINNVFSFIVAEFTSEWNKRKIKSCGKGSKIRGNFSVMGGECIQIGSNTVINSNTSITAWPRYMDQHFTPEIIIGDNCGIGERTHITAINSINIGNGVLLGKNVLITDNAHGNNSLTQLSIIPSVRPLTSKGPIVIEDNVWIGQNVCILPGVSIGRGAVIAANSVVNTNVEANTIVGGIPSKLIKKII